MEGAQTVFTLQTRDGNLSPSSSKMTDVVSEVSLEKLCELLEVDPTEGCDPWGAGFYLDLARTTRRVRTEPFDAENDDYWKWTRTFHAERVRYFVEHPDEIEAIQVVGRIGKWDIENPVPFADITDGWHRFHALLILNYDTIEIEYKGEAEVLAILQKR